MEKCGLSLCLIHLRDWGTPTPVLTATTNGLPFVKILYLTDLAQKLLFLRIFSYLVIFAHISLSLRISRYLCATAISAHI